MAYPPPPPPHPSQNKQQPPYPYPPEPYQQPHQQPYQQPHPQQYYPPSPPQYANPYVQPYQNAQPYVQPGNAQQQPGSYQQPFVSEPPSSDGYHKMDSDYEKFSPIPKWQDLWAAILFFIHLMAFLALASVSIPKFLSQAKSNSSLPGGLSIGTPELMVFGSSIATGFFLSLAYLLLMQRLAGWMIKVTLVLSILLYFLMAAYMFILKSFIAAGITLLFAVLYAFAAYTWRDRIPFATILLESVVKITRKFPGTVGIAVVGMIIQVLYTTLFCLTVVGIPFLFSKDLKTVCKVGKNGQTRCQTELSVEVYGVIVFALFSFYWTSQVIQNVVHVTISGVFAVYYFLFGTPQMPSSSPTFSSLKRATTTSFGSICFGSLIIALIQTLRAILNILRDQEDGILAFVACILSCIVGCIESFVEWFNHYAFTQVAIYGKPFCQAAKDTWSMIKDRGVEAVINDNLIGNVLGMGAILIGVINAVIGYVILLKLRPEIIPQTALLVIILVICFIIGLGMMSLVSGVIESGTATTFVTLAEEPAVLARNQPELFEKIRQTWPQVASGFY